MKLVHGSLFSGIGGFDLASQWCGWTNAFNCEINPFCRQVLQYHFKDSISYEDIRQTDFTEWRGKIDVLTGGFPCQPFSVAGLRRGKDDDRYLWPEMLRVIREINPTWIVGENVAGITSMVQPGKITEMGGQSTIFGKNTRRICRQEYVIETICKDLEKEGYSVQTFIPLERHIEETECGLFPEEKKKWDYLIPTPMATNVTHLKRVKELMNKGVTFHSRLNGEKRPNSIIDYLIFNNLIDTPISSIWKGTVGQEKLKRKDGKTRTRDMKNLPAIMGISGMGFQLSPLYVQEMMGFPSMWIVSPFLLTNGEKNP